MDIKCVVCEQESFSIFSVEGALIYKCRQCNLEFAHPMPSEADLGKFYSDYTYYNEYDREMIRETVKKNNRKNKEYLARFGLLKESRLMDFGCGENLFVLEEHSNTWVGYDYPHGQLADPSAKYDFITLWGVLEHVPDPVKILTDLSLKIVTGGKIVITTVGTETGIPYRYRFPVHLTWWSQKAMKELLQKCHFKVLELTNYQMIQNPKFYLDRVLDRGRVPPEIKEKITINIEHDILVPTNEILMVGERL